MAKREKPIHYHGEGMLGPIRSEADVQREVDAMFAPLNVWGVQLEDPEIIQIAVDIMRCEPAEGEPGMYECPKKLADMLIKIDFWKKRAQDFDVAIAHWTEQDKAHREAVRMYQDLRLKYNQLVENYNRLRDAVKHRIERD